MSTTQNSNPIPTPTPATEEEKNLLLKALRELWEAIKYKLTHSNHGMLLQQVERMADAIEEQLEQNALNQEKVQELTELFNSVQGEMDTITPEKIKDVLEEAKTIMAGDFVQSLQIDKEDFFEAISPELNKICIKTGRTVPENIAEALQEKATLIDAGKENSLLIEYDGILLQATYLPDEKRIHLEATYLSIKDITNDDGTLKEGYQYVERQVGSLEQDLSKALCDKCGIPYEFDKEAAKAKVLENLSPIGAFVASHSQKLTDKETGESFNNITITENGRYESYYYTGDNSFRIRDTETNKTISVVASEGKIEFFVAEDTLSMPQTATDRGTRIGQIAQEGKDIHARLTFGDVSIASMFHSEELSKYLELSGISEKQQREMLLRKEDVTWSKVEDAGMEKVEQLRDACRKVCSRQGQYHVSVQNTNSNYTFLVVSQKKGLGNANPAISFAFDKNGDVKAINFRESGTTKTADGKETNHRYRYMHSFVTKSVSADFHRLQNDPEFASLYRLAMDSLKEAGIDVSRSCMQAKKNTPIISSPQVFFDVIPERDLELKPSTNNYANERFFAEQVAKAAAYAFEHGKISMADIRGRLNIGEDSKAVMSELVNLGVVSGKGMNRKDTRTTSDLFARKICAIAESPQTRGQYALSGHTESYVAFLPQAYKKHLESEQQTAFGKLNTDEKRNVITAMEKLLADVQADKPIELKESYLQSALALSCSDAHRTLNHLKAMGVINHGIVLTTDELEARLTECEKQLNEAIEASDFTEKSEDTTENLEKRKNEFIEKFFEDYNIEARPLQPLSEFPDIVIKATDAFLYEKVSELTKADVERLALRIQESGMEIAEARQYAYSIYASMITEDVIDMKGQALVGESSNGRYLFTEKTLSDYLKIEQEKEVPKSEPPKETKKTTGMELG